MSNANVSRAKRQAQPAFTKFMRLVMQPVQLEEPLDTSKLNQQSTGTLLLGLFHYVREYGLGIKVAGNMVAHLRERHSRRRLGTGLAVADRDVSDRELLDMLAEELALRGFGASNAAVITAHLRLRIGNASFN